MVVAMGQSAMAGDPGPVSDPGGAVSKGLPGVAAGQPGCRSLGKPGHGTIDVNRDSLFDPDSITGPCPVGGITLESRPAVVGVAGFE